MYFALRAVPLLILFLIPGLNLLAPLLWLAFSAWFLALEYADFPMANHGLGFKEQHRRLKQQRLTSLGFGAGATLLTLIPVLNFVAVPAAVAGATGTCQPLLDNHFKDNVPMASRAAGRVGKLTALPRPASRSSSVTGLIVTSVGGRATTGGPATKRSGCRA